jgi:tryptophan-rich sensory protein
MNYLAAAILCILAAGFETLCAGRDPLVQLRETKQPAWSPPNWVWVLIGIGWYVICFTALERLLPLWPERKAPVVLLFALMLANGGAGLLQFRMKRLDLAFFFLAPYWILLGLFLSAACPIDRLVCGMFAVYCVYQLYAAAWGYRLWRMNPGSRRIG